MVSQTETGCPDWFEVITGPGDGLEFPITRTPIDIGSGQECGVHLQFDRHVDQVHARATVVSEGYRIRQLYGGPVYVNWKRAGRLRSRIARTGSIVRVGDTELLVQCTPDGLASRSRGMPLESDIGYALRIMFPAVLSALRAPAGPLKKLVTRYYRIVLPVAVVLIIIWFVRPGLLRWAWGWTRYGFAWAWWYINHFFRQLISYLPGITQLIQISR